MPAGDKSKYTEKQKRKAAHIAESYEKKGVPEDEAEGRAWATVNKDDGGGKMPGGSGRGVEADHPAQNRGGEHRGGEHRVAEPGGAASANRLASSRPASAGKAAATRKRLTVREGRK